MNQNSKYEEILSLENDRVSKSKDIVNSLLATGANVILIASDEVDRAIENLLVANKVFAVLDRRDRILVPLYSCYAH